jgi:hypothetical protein
MEGFLKVEKAIRKAINEMSVLSCTFNDNTFDSNHLLLVI